MPYNVIFFYPSGIFNSNIIYKYTEQIEISLNKFIIINVSYEKTKISWKNKNIFGLKANNFSQEKQKVTILGKREGDQCFCLLFQLFCNKQSEINITINKAHGIKMRKKKEQRDQMCCLHFEFPSRKENLMLLVLSFQQQLVVNFPANSGN